MNYDDEPRFYNNRGLIHPYVALALILVSMGLAGNIYYGVFLISYWFAAAPVLFLLGSMWVFRLLVNSHHYALHLAEGDAEARYHHQMIAEAQHNATLGVDHFLEGLRDDDERVGRA